MSKKLTLSYPFKHASKMFASMLNRSCSQFQTVGVNMETSRKER